MNNKSLSARVLLLLFSRIKSFRGIVDFLLTKRGKAFRYGINFSVSGNNSVVECNLAKVEVASSNLVSRSIFSFISSFPTCFFSSGGIAKW